jgi:hypothetical protein
MSPARALQTVVVVALLVTAAVGCGGSSGSGSGSTTTAETTTAANKRLSAAQWQSYESAAKSFKAANTEANTRLKKCPVPANGQTSGSYSLCLGDSLTNLQAETKSAAALLTSLGPSTAGACETALGDLLNYMTPYQGSVQALQQAIKTNNASQTTHYAQAVQTTAQNARQQLSGFESSCAPA